MTKIKKVKIGTIEPMPPFKSLEEESNYWDSHSMVDDIEEGVLVGFHQANKTGTLTIRFQPKYLEMLRRYAFKRGVGPTTLVRMWVLERLQDKLTKKAKL